MGTFSERWIKRRESAEKWKVANYEYYLEQKRRCAHRPEYLAHRRVMYKAKRSNAGSASLSTREILNESEETYQRPDNRLDHEPEPATRSTQRYWPSVT